MLNKDRVLKYLGFSEDARLDESDLRKKYEDVMVFSDKQTDTQGFISLDAKTGELVIAFRGTQQAKDFLTDFNAFHMIYPYGNLDTKIMVHRGFMGAYLSIRDKIHNYLKTKWGVNNIIVTGHSLGGALATLCAVDIQYNFTSKIECFVSGNPMVGNRYFVESYNKRVPNTIRTYMRRDTVVYCPPEWFEKKSYEGWSHAGIANPIGPTTPFFGLIMFFKKRFHSKDFLDSLFNHNIDLYRDEIKKA